MVIFRVLLTAAVTCLAVTAPPALAPPAPAQTATAAGPAQTPSFDVASIRENKSLGGRNHIYSSPNDGHFRTGNAPLKMILEFAYGIPETQIVDAPGWLDAAKFDIDAKADASVDDQMHALTSDQGRRQKQQMVQALLADRFQLKTHQETRPLPVFALVVAKGGAKFLASEAHGTTIDGGRSHIHVQGRASVANLAEQLARALGRPVIDQTGLDGRYDITLKWTPDDAPAPLLNGAPDPNPPPDIFTAIQEQLGLKLESTKGPVPVLVIDHIAMPSDN